MFRNLKADEIEVRVATVKNNGFSLLIYKNARVDMSILDETVGAMEWKREQISSTHCKVSIFNNDMKEWITKEDFGEGKDDKSASSDSFKRACFTWGIGTELYTAPFTWVNGDKYIKKNGNKSAVYEKFEVSEIVTTEDKKIVKLVIKDSKGAIVFRYDVSIQAEATKHPSTQKIETKIVSKEEATKIELIEYIKENTREEPRLSWLRKRLVKLGTKSIKDLSVLQLTTIYNKIYSSINKAS